MPFVDQLKQLMIEGLQFDADQAARLIRSNPRIVIQGIQSKDLSATATTLVIADQHPSLRYCFENEDMSAKTITASRPPLAAMRASNSQKAVQRMLL